MAKRFKFHLSLPSFHFGHSKQPSSLPKNTSPSPKFPFSPLNYKSLDISFPNCPDPPPSTPTHTKETNKTNNSNRLSSKEEEEEEETENIYDYAYPLKNIYQILRKRKKNGKLKVRRLQHCVSQIPIKGKVRESFAVVKRSENPYEDFKRSMLDMILVKQMFEDKELEQLLECFLSLNSRQHHKVIVLAFTEIWEDLFCSTEFI